MARPLHLGNGLSLDETMTTQLEFNDEEIAYTSLDGHAHLASIEEKKRLWWRNAVFNALFIASWFFFAIFLSVYNKWMFSESHFHFPYPLFVTTLHMIVQFFLSTLVLKIWPRTFRTERNPTMEEFGKKAVPTAAATSLDIGFSNLSLKTISLSFYTMVKSSSLIFVLLFAFSFRLERFSWTLVGVILLICTGVLLMVATETHFVVGGFILVLSASGLGGLRWALTQTLLQNKKMGFSNPAATIFWLSPVMALILGVLSMVIEGWGSLFQTEFFSSTENTLRTTGFLIMPGLFAFCMVLSEFYILQRAGVVPMSIAGIAKEVTTITISAWFFGDELTPLNITGVAITVCGIALYTYHKYQKSLHSTIPLDGHGNPIVAEDALDVQSGDRGYLVELGETARLTAGRESEEELGVQNESTNPRLLFSAEDDDGEDMRFVRDARTSADSGPQTTRPST